MSINLCNRQVTLRSSTHLRQTRWTRGNRTKPSLSYSAPVIDIANSHSSVSNNDIADITSCVRNLISFEPSGLLCGKYTGSDSNTKVDAWLDIFKLVTIDYSEHEKLKTLGRQVSGDVINWLARDIFSRYQDITWTECRQLMTQRFGRVTVNPLVEATKRVLSPRETLLDYYNTIRRLLDSSSTSELNQVAMLTERIPKLYRIQIATARQLSTN